MIRDLTLGQYYAASSPLHALDPRVKLVGTLLYVISLFTVAHPLGYVLAAGFLLALVACSRVPLRFMLRGMKGIFIFLVITVVFDLFIVPGRAIYSFGVVTVSAEGVAFALATVMRVVLLIVGASLLTLTTTPSRITAGLEKACGGLRRFRVPVGELALMLSIALGFVPLLLEEAARLSDAQKARGADFDSGNVFRRAKATLPLLIPVFVAAFRRADALAVAMEARGYDGSRARTELTPLRYTKKDAVAYVVLLCYFILSLLPGRLSLIS